MNKSTYEKILIEVVLIHAWRGKEEIHKFTNLQLHIVLHH